MGNKIYISEAIFCKRSDTLANWQKENPVLYKGEEVIIEDGQNGEWLKIGDGVTPFNKLPYKLGPKGEKGDKGEGVVTVDQSFNPESSNPQSGKAVAEALAKAEESVRENAEKMYAQLSLQAALKGRANGTIVSLNDINPVEHNLSVKLYSNIMCFTVLRAANFKHYASCLRLVDNNGLNALELTPNTEYRITYSIKVVSAPKEFYVGLYFVNNKNTNPGGSDPDYTRKYTTSAMGDDYITDTFVATAPDFNARVLLGVYNAVSQNDKMPVEIYIDNIVVIQGDTTITNIDFTEDGYKNHGNVSTDGAELISVADCGMQDFSNIKVQRLGKNLFDPSKFLAGSGWKKTDSGVYYGDSAKLYAVYKITSKNPMVSGVFKENTQYTISFLHRTTGNTGGITFIWKYTDGTTETTYTSHNNSDTLKRLSQTSKVGKTVAEIYTSYAQTSTSYFSEVQLEEGTTATEYEPYIEPVEFSANADGTIQGNIYLYPSMTLIPDTEGVIITAEYNRDINKAFAALERAILNI